MAGLAAARELQLRGRDAVVLEARDRIGGRVHTLRPCGWPVPVEAGAEFVHGRPKVLLPLAREAREVQGSHYSGAFERQDDLWNSVMEKLEKLPSTRERTVAEALRTLRWRLRTTSEERQLAADFLEGFNAARLDRASLKAIAQQLRASARIEGDRISRLPRGYDVVPHRLARGLRIELRSRVRLVRWSRSGVQVLTDDRRWEGRRAIVTLPLGVLQAGAVRFEPRLPGWKDLLGLLCSPASSIGMSQCSHQDAVLSAGSNCVLKRQDSFFEHRGRQICRCAERTWSTRPFDRSRRC